MKCLPRWMATITYRSEGGDFDIDYAFEEIEDLHDIVERGPNFYGIKKIEISLQPANGLTGKTIEELER